MGTFRILPYIGRLCATCGVPAVVHLLDRRDGDAAEQDRGVRAVRLPYAGRWKGAPSPLAAYVGADGRVAQLSLVDTLLGLAAFAEGCPTAALRKWPWTLQEWTERYSDERHEAARHLADTVAADPS